MGATRTAIKILAIQLAITLLAAAVAFTLSDFDGFKSAYSALLGGGINILATAFFALRVFSVRPGSTAKRMARAFYTGEVAKIALTAALFAAVLVWLDVAFLPLFLTYVITMLAFWLVLPFTL